MGVFSKLKSLAFDKDPLGIVKKGEGVAKKIGNLGSREKSEAYKMGEAAAAKSKQGISGNTHGPSNWIISRGAGKTTAMAIPQPKSVSRTSPKGATRVTAPVKSSKVFSHAKAKTKIPSYNKIPEFAKNYTRVPPRTFIRDLSDSNLNRVFGAAKPAPPKGRDPFQQPKNQTQGNVSNDPFLGLPKVDLPTIAKSEPKPSVIASPQPKVAAASPSTPVSTAKSAAYGAATGVALGLGTVAALAHAGKEPRSQHGRRKPTDRRQTNMPHPFGEEVGAASEKRTAVRRALGQRRDDEHGLTGTKKMRGKTGPSAEAINAEYAKSTYGEQGKKDYSGFRAENAAAEERRLKDVGGLRRAGDPQSKPIKPRIRSKRATVSEPGTVVRSVKLPTATATPAQASSPTPAAPVATAVHPASTTAHTTSLAAAKDPAGTPAPVVKRRGRPKKVVGGAAPTAPETPSLTPEQRVKANEARIAEIEGRLSKEVRAAGGMETKPPTTAVAASPTASLTVEQRNAKIKELEAKIAAKRHSQASAPSVPAATQPSKKDREIARLAGQQERDEARTTYKYRGQPFPKNRGSASSVRESTSPIVDPNPHELREAAKGRKVKRARRVDPVRKGETTVGSSQSLTQGVKALENAERNKAIERYIKKKGVTRVPAAGEKQMFPERFEDSTPHTPGQHVRSITLPKLGTPEAPKVETPRAPALSGDALKKAFEDAKAENMRLKGQTAVSTTGSVKATAPPRVTMRRPSKSAQAKAAPPPQVITKNPALSGGKEILKSIKFPKAGKKLGIAAIAGIGAGALMSGSEAKAASGSLMAGAKAAGKSLYESGREMAKFSMGASIATRLPGFAGAASRFALGKVALPLAAGVGAYDTYEAGKQGYGAFRAKRAAEKEAKASAAKYGTVAAATATRHARERAKGLRK